MELDEFLNKRYLVTGVTSGIGLELAKRLLLSGANVLGFGRDFSKIKSEKVIINNENFTFCQLDLVNDEAVEIRIKEYCTATSKFDGFIHCAGKEETIPLSIYKNDKIASLFEINVFSGINLLRIFSKKKILNDNSSIVFISSVMGELGQPGKVGYCSSKAAVLGIVRAAALEMSKRNIRVNAISPGVVNTPMTQKLFNTLTEENIERIKQMHPLGIGEVEDVVPTMLFLLSNNSKWITGQNIVIDGGYSIQ